MFVSCPTLQVVQATTDQLDSPCTSDSQSQPDVEPAPCRRRRATIDNPNVITLFRAGYSLGNRGVVHAVAAQRQQGHTDPIMLDGQQN
jgi:hypothetical protein